MRAPIPAANVSSLSIPHSSELFSKEAMVERHPNLLNSARMQWALRNRARNGLSGVVYESKSGRLLVHEPEFLRWYLGLTGRAKPRASHLARAAEAFWTIRSSSHQARFTGSLFSRSYTFTPSR